MEELIESTSHCKSNILRGRALRIDIVVCLGAVLLGAALSGASWFQNNGVTGDTFEYLYGGISYVNHRGFLSLTGGHQEQHAPLYPLSVGWANKLVNDPMLTGRLLSLLASVTTIALIYWLARYYLSMWAAFSAAIVFALAPPRVAISAWIGPEAMYEFLLCLTLLCYFCFRRLSLWGTMVATGLLGGTLYLTRQEGLVYPVALAGYEVFLRRDVRLSHRVVHALMIMGITGSMAWPYIWYIHHYTGQWAISVKVAYNLAIDSVISKGGPITAIRVLNPAGTHVQPPPCELRSSLDWILHYASNGQLFVEKTAQYFGGGLLLLTCLLSGAYSWTKNPQHVRCRNEFLALLAILLGIILVALPVFWVPDRYVIFVVPGLALLLGLGLYQLSQWAYQLVQSMKVPLSVVFVIAILLSAVACIWSLETAKKLSAVGLKGADVDTYSTLATWFKNEHLAGGRVLSDSTTFAYLADLRHNWLPFDSPQRTIKYAQHVGVRYIAASTIDDPNPTSAALLHDWRTIRGIRLVAERRGELAKG